MDGEHFLTCPLCEATCGLKVRVTDGRVDLIRGDEKDVFSGGFLCPKGSLLHKIHDDPDRLRTPMIKRDGKHVPATWEEAYAAIEQGLTPILEAGNRNAIGLYVGNPNAHNHANAIYGRTLIQALGTNQIYSASTVDQMPKHVSCGMMFGDPDLIPVPDLDRTDYLLMLGANPVESNGSVCTAPDMPGRLKAISARGGRVVVVDPRRTRTADLADQHIAIRPGTDAIWLAAVARLLLDGAAERLGDQAEYVTGLDELADVLAGFTPEFAESICGISPDVTKSVATGLADNERSAVYGRIGTHTTTAGTVASWLVDLCNLLAGSLDRPGGAMFSSAVHGIDRAEPGGRGFRIGRHQSRVKGYPEVRREFPAVTLPDEILEPGDGQIRAMIVIGGNPARSLPDTARMEQAFDSLEFMVSVDIFLNETSRCADVILPPPSSLERTHYDLALYNLAVRNVANYSPAVFEAEGPHEEDIFAKLALIVAGQGAQADVDVMHALTLDAVLGARQAAVPEMGERPIDDLRAMVTGDTPADRVLDVMVRAGRYGDRFGAVPDGLTLDKLKAHPHGIDLGPLQPRLPNAVQTPDGAVAAAPPEFVARLKEIVETLATSADSPVLIGRRDVRSNNSWLHNVKGLVKGKDRCTLWVNPLDAAEWGMTDGDTALVASSVGELEVSVEVTDRTMVGVVSLPHGWGHDAPGTELKIANEHAGVNMNALVPPTDIDPLSGNATLTGIPVNVTAAVH